MDPVTRMLNGSRARNLSFNLFGPLGSHRVVTSLASALCARAGTTSPDLGRPDHDRKREAGRDPGEAGRKTVVGLAKYARRAGHLGATKDPLTTASTSSSRNTRFEALARSRMRETRISLGSMLCRRSQCTTF